MKKQFFALLLALSVLGLGACGSPAAREGMQASDTGASDGSGHGGLQRSAGQQGEDDAAASETKADDAKSDSKGDAIDSGKESIGEKAAGQDTAVGEIRLTVTRHRIETEAQASYEDRTFPLAWIVYPDIMPDEGTKKAYPALAERLQERNEDSKDAAYRELASISLDAQEGMGAWLMSSMEDSYDTAVVRADERIYCELCTIDTFFNGAHPTQSWRSFACEPKTGEALPLSDVINDMFALPELLLAHLETVNDEGLTEEDKAEILPKIEQMVSEGELIWTLEEDGFHAYFDAYDLMFYAFGPIFVTLPYDSFPDLIREEYLPMPEAAAVSKRVDYRETDTVFVSDTEIEALQAEIPEDAFNEEYFPEGDEASFTQGEGDNAGIYVVENPGWEYYAAPGVTDGGISASPWLFKLVEKTEIDTAENWAAQHGFTLPNDVPNESAYTAGEYSYYVDTDDKGRLAVELSDAASGNDIGTYDLSAFKNPPDKDESHLFADLADTKILYAEAYDGVLYVAIGHQTYAAAEPHTSYILAIDMDDGQVLWRSSDQVAGMYNFLIGEDTLICGYGFTEEEDYLYVLNRHNGSILDIYPLDTRPDYLIPSDDSLYVLAYSSAYEFNVVGSGENGDAANYQARPSRGIAG